jgi:hypothetical protein
MKLKSVELSKLLLDEKNPRLPEDLTSRSQTALLNWMANEYNTIEVARSMAEHGYFDSEPLIAIQKGSSYIVVEGNRRLTAAKLLSDADLRKDLALDEADVWDELGGESELEDSFPVLVAKDRSEVAPIIGYRHIAGVEPWDPWAKARFIGAQVDAEKLPFGKVAIIVGEPESDVRAHYRNYRLMLDAKDNLDLEVSRAKKKFGIFTRAMNSPGLRTHMGAPAPSEVSRGKKVLDRARKKEVAEVFSWLFGTEDAAAVITDSRQISELGEVVASAPALKVLRQTRDLEEAMHASGGIKQRLIKRLKAALQALEKAEPDLGKFTDDPDVNVLLARCSEIVGRLKAQDE